MLAGDLGQQPAKFGGTLHGGLGGAWSDERAQPLERDGGGGDAEGGAGALQEACALLLEAAAADHLRLDVGEAGEHRVGVALADGRTLGEDELEEMTCGVGLRVQVDQQLSLEDGGAHRATPGVPEIERLAPRRRGPGSLTTTASPYKAG